MAAAFQASIRYPFIWIINTTNPGESEPIVNKVHRKIKKMVRFTDWLRAHYETSYHYYLAEHLITLIFSFLLYFIFLTFPFLVQVFVRIPV